MWGRLALETTPAGAPGCIDCQNFSTAVRGADMSRSCLSGWKTEVVGGVGRRDCGSEVKGRGVGGEGGPEGECAREV